MDITTFKEKLATFSYDYQIIQDDNKDRSISDSIFLKAIYYDNRTATLHYEDPEGIEHTIQFTGGAGNLELLKHLKELDINHMRSLKGITEYDVILFRVNNQNINYTVTGGEDE